MSVKSYSQRLSSVPGVHARVLQEWNPYSTLGDARSVGGGAYVGRRKWVSDGNSNTALGDNSNSNTRVDLGFSAQELAAGARISSIR